MEGAKPRHYSHDTLACSSLLPAHLRCDGPGGPSDVDSSWYLPYRPGMDRRRFLRISLASAPVKDPKVAARLVRALDRDATVTEYPGGLSGGGKW